MASYSLWLILQIIWDFMATYRLTRSMEDRVFGGVCGGIGGYLNISGWWIRAGFVALTAASWAFGLLAYLLLWFVIPAQTLTEIVPLTLPGQAPKARYARPESMLLLGLLIIAAGIVILAQNAGFLQASYGDLLLPAMLFLVALALLIKNMRG